MGRSLNCSGSLQCVPCHFCFKGQLELDYRTRRFLQLVIQPAPALGITNLNTFIFELK